MTHSASSSPFFAFFFLPSLRSHRPRRPLSGRVPGQGGHRGAAHRPVFFPVLPLAFGVTIEGLGTIFALRQIVAVFAAVEAFLDVDPHGLFVGFFLAVLASVFRLGGSG